MPPWQLNLVQKLKDPAVVDTFRQKEGGGSEPLIQGSHCILNLEVNFLYLFVYWGLQAIHT